MPNLESIPTSGGEASNSHALHSALIDKLLGSEATWASDAHYYYFDLSPDGEFAGASGRADDYHSYSLRAHQALIVSQREANMTALDAGLETLPFDSYGATQADRHSFLKLGIACVSVELTAVGDSGRRTLAVVRPNDLIPDDPLARAIVAQAGADRALDQPLVYDVTANRIPGEPFIEPHLVALYRHLHAPS